MRERSSTFGTMVGFSRLWVLFLLFLFVLWIIVFAIPAGFWYVYDVALSTQITPATVAKLDGFTRDRNSSASIEDLSEKPEKLFGTVVSAKWISIQHAPQWEDYCRHEVGQEVSFSSRGAFKVESFPGGFFNDYMRIFSSDYDGRCERVLSVSRHAAGGLYAHQFRLPAPRQVTPEQMKLETQFANDLNNMSYVKAKFRYYERRLGLLPV